MKKSIPIIAVSIIIFLVVGYFVFNYTVKKITEREVKRITQEEIGRITNEETGKATQSEAGRITDEVVNKRTEDEIDIMQTKGLGKLCSSLSDCFIFCKNSVGRCTDFCKKNPNHELCIVPEAAKPQEWIKDAVTQPLPEGASKVRLVLYAPLDTILLTGLGGYGAHRGGHPEGLDHEWIPVKKGVVMTSWADGYVVWARPAPGDAGYDRGQMNVVVYYGDGLWGEHMGLDRNKVLVKEGQRVKAGDPIG